MSRLRQKYKRLKREYERMRVMPMPTIQQEPRHIQTYHLRKMVSKQQADIEGILKYIDLQAAREIGETLMRDGAIDSTSLADECEHEEMVVVDYVVNVVMPPVYF